MLSTRVRRRGSTFFVLTIGATLLGGGIARASTASPVDRHVTAAALIAAPALSAPAVTPKVTNPGTAITVSGTGCVPGVGPSTQVFASLNGPTGVYVSSVGVSPGPTGQWTARLTVPTSTSPGSYKVDSSCDQYVSFESYPSVSVTVTSPYHAVSPTPLFDTRLGSGGVTRAPVAARHLIKVKVAGLHGVPKNATAVALNVTAVGATAATAVTVWPDGVARPATPALYAPKAAPVGLFDIVSLSDGYVDFFNAAGKVNLAAAIAGYSN
jgi:hypothetical protein